MKTSIDLSEGPEAFERFDNLVSVLSVPRSVILEPEAEYKKQAALNPQKRGPKAKRKSSSFRAPRVEPLS